MLVTFDAARRASAFRQLVPARHGGCDETRTGVSEREQEDRGADEPVELGDEQD